MREPSKTQTEDVAPIRSQPVPQRPAQTSLSKVPGNESAVPGKRTQGADERPVTLEGLYIISVAARILDMHPQTLRKYERLGLINPGRTMGMLRLYSRDDIRKVRLIRHLGNLGLNLAGVEFALATVDNLLALKRRLKALTGGTGQSSALDHEIDRVFQNLNLPVKD